MRVKRIGTDKEAQYTEPEVYDEVWVRDENDKLVKVEVKQDDPETGQ